MKEVSLEAGLSGVGASTKLIKNRSALTLVQVYARLHGQHIDQAQMQHQFLQGKDELGLGGVVQILQVLGFDAKVVCGDMTGMAAVPAPLLAWSKDGALLLVGRVNDASVVFQREDSDVPEQMLRTDFVSKWSGQWIAASRRFSDGTRGTEQAASFGFGWFWESLQKYKILMGEVLLASFFVQIFALLTPLIFQVVVDKVLTHRSLTTLDVMVIALLGVSIFEVVLGAMRHYLSNHTTNRIDVELGAKLFRHLMHLPLSYFESRRSGDTVARVRELENARAFMTGQALTAWLDLLFALIFMAVMFYYSATLTLIVVAALPLLFGASWLITPLLRSKLEDKFAVGANNQAFLVETVTAMETLKSQAVEPHWQREWERRLAEYVNISFHSSHLANATNQFIGLASKLLSVLLLWFGAREVIDGQLTVGGLIAFNMLAGRVNAPVLKLASLWQEFTQMKVSVKRLADIMDAPAEPAFKPGRATPAEISGRVTFDRVGFRYAAGGQEILSELSFDVHPGEIIGVVGVSGAGKTTLMRLIQRLYTPEKGRLLIDGMDLNLVDTSWLRRQIGVVGQDTQLFNRSIRENIAFSNLDLGMQSVIHAAQLAGAHDFILEMPEGYDTVIGERGSRLSGGQRARIAIARALVTNPRLLLLDEATASLDYESERVIHDNMEKIATGRTVFIVAHRLSTLRLANRILVLEKGRLIETGNHAELITHMGRYSELYRAHQILERPDPATLAASACAAKQPSTREETYV